MQLTLTFVTSVFFSTFASYYWHFSNGVENKFVE